ncbi:hypothetical protein [Salinarchaeum laminariae]|uniref:hypothetical protein n=1 Tax=Salinarchaeum laminariae TaxID=869888 RepID=UPI002175663F|nr:hypothetical protein [Salinarchaeum laminariae]
MTDSSFDVGRLARLVLLIAGVTAVFLFGAAQQLDDEVFQIGAVAIAAVAVVTAMTAFLIAAGETYDHTQGR